MSGSNNVERNELEAALLITGAFGVGKSTVAEEIADILETAGARYAAIDLDWLSWANVPGAAHDEHDLLARNLRDVAANYRDAGARLFVLAGSIARRETLAAIERAVGLPLVVVRLTASMALIEERLTSSPTSARADDLERAREWLADDTGVGLEDFVVENAGPVRRTALDILKLAGWMRG